MNKTLSATLTALALITIPVALTACDQKTETKKETTTTTTPANPTAPDSSSTTTTTTTDKKD